MFLTATLSLGLPCHAQLEWCQMVQRKMHPFEIFHGFTSDVLNALLVGGHIGAPGVSAGKCTVSVLNPSPQNHRSETIATPLGLMCPW